MLAALVVKLVMCGLKRETPIDVRCRWRESHASILSAAREAMDLNFEVK